MEIKKEGFMVKLCKMGSNDLSIYGEGSSGLFLLHWVKIRVTYPLNSVERKSEKTVKKGGDGKVLPRETRR